jgi:hypothetical protein
MNARVAILGCLVGSAVALAVAPLVVPGDYRGVSQSISESAGQGVSGAWVARAGFVLFGLGVIWIAATLKDRWGRWGTALHSAFGVLMVTTAAFSHKPWRAGIPFDATEDVLHSVAATLMGFAFAIGVIAVVLHRRPRRQPTDPLALLVVSASVVLPIGMGVAPNVAGVLQRAMFLAAYAWYGSEVMSA